MKLIHTTALLLLVSECNRLVVSAEEPARPDDVIGVWHLSGETILAHDMREAGVTQITKEQRRELLPLAEELGTRYRLIMRSDGKWELHSLLSGPIDPKEETIFTALLGEPCSKDFYYKHQFPNDPKRPSGGKWTVSPTGELNHSGMQTPYPIGSPGKLVVEDQLLTFFDKEGEVKMIFKFARKYKHDPDPKHRPPVK